MVRRDRASRWILLMASVDFRRLKTCADAAARYYSSRLSDAVHPDSEAAPIVGLLCPSGPEFLLTVFGCIRLGLGVLLLAYEPEP